MQNGILLPEAEATKKQHAAAIQGLRMELAAKNMAHMLAVEYSYALEKAHFSQMATEFEQEDEKDPFGVGHLRDDENQPAARQVDAGQEPPQIELRTGMIAHFALGAADQLLIQAGVMKAPPAAG